MQFNIEPTLENLRIEAEEATDELDSIQDEAGKLYCLSVIARYEDAVNQQYNNALDVIMAPVQGNLRLLVRQFEEDKEMSARYSRKGISKMKKYVIDCERSVSDGNWLTISYIKPTIKLKSKEVLQGYIIANPEAAELVEGVPARTRMMKWKPHLLT